MKPNRIILIRHGESTGNIDESVYGKIPDYKLVLSENGKKQAEDCGKKLKEFIHNESCFFYVSPFWRTRETFNQIQKSFKDELISFIEEPRIREQEWGHLRNAEDNEIINTERDKFGTFYFRIPDGESGADVYDRVSNFFGTLHRDFNKEDFPENCVIISHGMTIRLFLMKWFHWTIEEFENIRNPKNCQIIILDKRENGKYQLTSKLKKRNYHIANKT